MDARICVVVVCMGYCRITRNTVEVSSINSAIIPEVGRHFRNHANRYNDFLVVTVAVVVSIVLLARYC